MRQLTLPDGLDVFSINPNETRFVHGEIFGARCYLQHGIQLRDGDCVFDVGANIGLASVFFHRERQGIRIFAFEPSPVACECLKQNVGLHGADALIFECGLSAEAGTADFTFYPGNSVMSGFHADPDIDRRTTKTFMMNRGVAPANADRFLGALFKKETFSCRLRTISEIIDEEAVERIDLLKVDVEKSEREVLAGIRPEHWSRIRQAVVEVHDEHGALEAVLELLMRQGFQVATEMDPLLQGTSLSMVFATRP